MSESTRASVKQHLEVGGEDVFYWEHFATEYMVEVYERGMRACADCPERLQGLVARADIFSWKNAAAKYSALYERILLAVH